MAAHESQSLIVEMQACRSDAFLGWLGGELHLLFGGDPAPYAAGNLARLWRRVERGFIRVDADEMTYPAHVILRFRLERAMVAGDLAVADLPGAWNDGMQDLLGITPPDDAQRLPAGHPLVRRRVRLLPQLHARRDGRGATDGGGPPRGGRAGRGARPRRPARRWWAGCARKVHGMGSLLGFNDLLRQRPASRSTRPISRRIWRRAT